MNLAYISQDKSEEFSFNKESYANIVHKLSEYFRDKTFEEMFNKGIQQ